MSEADILADLEAAEAEWIAARDSSGYAKAADWAMRRGLRLIFDYRRAVQAYLAAPALVEALEETILLFADGVGAMTDNGDPERQERNIQNAKATMAKGRAALALARGGK